MFILALFIHDNVHIEIVLGKRKSFSLNEKRSVLKAYDRLPKISQQDTAARLFLRPCVVYSNNEKQYKQVASDGDRK